MSTKLVLGKGSPGRKYALKNLRSMHMQGLSRQQTMSLPTSAYVRMEVCCLLSVFSKDRFRLDHTMMVSCDNDYTSWSVWKNKIREYVLILQMCSVFLILNEVILNRANKIVALETHAPNFNN